MATHSGNCESETGLFELTAAGLFGIFTQFPVSASESHPFLCQEIKKDAYSSFSDRIDCKDTTKKRMPKKKAARVVSDFRQKGDHYRSARQAL